MTVTSKANAKYMWGDEPFVMSINLILMGLGSAMVSSLVLLWEKGEPAIDSGCDIQSVGLTIIATVLYFFVWYQLLGHQIALRILLKSTNETAHNTADRIVFNTLEQMPCFLLFTWLFTIYVDWRLGGRFGLFYAILVAVYAFGYAFYGHFTVLVELSTQPRYIMILYMGLSLLRVALWPSEPCLRSILPSSWASLTVTLFVMQFIFSIPGWMIFGMPLAKMNVSNNPDKKID